MSKKKKKKKRSFRQGQTTKFLFRMNKVLSYCILLCSIICTALYYTVLYCTVLHCTVLYCTVLYCTIECCIELSVWVQHLAGLKGWRGDLVTLCGTLHHAERLLDHLSADLVLLHHLLFLHQLAESFSTDLTNRHDTTQHNFIVKCQYHCTRNVLWCQVHSLITHSR